MAFVPSGYKDSDILRQTVDLIDNLSGGGITPTDVTQAINDSEVAKNETFLDTSGISVFLRNDEPNSSVFNDMTGFGAFTWNAPGPGFMSVLKDIHGNPVFLDINDLSVFTDKNNEESVFYNYIDEKSVFKNHQDRSVFTDPDNRGVFNTNIDNYSVFKNNMDGRSAFLWHAPESFGPGQSSIFAYGPDHATNPNWSAFFGTVDQGGGVYPSIADLNQQILDVLNNTYFFLSNINDSIGVVISQTKARTYENANNSLVKITGIGVDDLISNLNAAISTTYAAKAVTVQEMDLVGFTAVIQVSDF